MEKQIEEMAKALNEATFGVNKHTLADHLQAETINRVAEYLYNTGYRKQSEGKWILVGNGNGRAIHWKCSVCGFETFDAINGDTNFCPNCGADMRGGE